MPVFVGFQMSNTSLRKRFGIPEQNYASASRIIADTLKLGLIKPADPKS
jgi:ATP-dependent DNA helicase RecG